LRASKYQVKIFHREICIATHNRSWGKNKYVDNPGHFADLLKVKKAAHDSKLRERFLSLSPACAKYFEGLLQLDKDLKAELRQIMQQVELYGAYEVIPAIEMALHHQAFGAAYIKNIIAQNRARRQEKTILPLQLAKYPDLENIEVEPKNLADYDKFFESEENTNG
jgi:hypothetical protein